MKDLEIRLGNYPGALAEMGEALATAGISIDGGGAWVIGEYGYAHFLFQDGQAARKVLEKKSIDVISENEILIQRLKQDEPGQLGKIARLAQAGVNIKAMYSDHNNQMILVVDDFEKGKAISENWAKGLYQ